MSEKPQVNMDYLLRRVAKARAAGDVESARGDWETCVIRATARVRAVVASYRTVNGDRIPIADRDDVVVDALDRAMRRMIHTLDKLNERSFLAAMGACAENACKDHIRRLGSYERGLHGSLDDPGFEGAPGGRYDDALHREAERRQIDDAQAFEAAERLERGLAGMRNQRHRKAVELRRLGFENEEIAARLDVSVENAYQLVSRGFKDLRGLMES